MRVDQFDFVLPQEHIALYPQTPREDARLLYVAPQQSFQNHTISDLPTLLRPTDVLVVNDTKVIPARLWGMRIRKDARARCEILLHKRETPQNWWAFLRPAKKIEIGEEIDIIGKSPHPPLRARVLAKKEGGECFMSFSCAGPDLDMAILAHGDMPLPPYIAAHRPIEEEDATYYQTIFAQHPGAVAAPTAGLHFTPALISQVQARGIGLEYITLHVGAGTFLPVKVQDTHDHVMHAEMGYLSEETAWRLNEAKARGARIVAVGTTSLRLLETAVDERGYFHPFSQDTRLFITPGYRFRAVEALITNFHLPRSTLFMLVCAFMGTECMQQAYQHAIAHAYRFYSYGDACLLEREVSI